MENSTHSQMNAIATFIPDRDVQRIIRKYLNASAIQDFLCGEQVRYVSENCNYSLIFRKSLDCHSWWIHIRHNETQDGCRGYCINDMSFSENFIVLHVRRDERLLLSKDFGALIVPCGGKYELNIVELAPLNIRKMIIEDASRTISSKSEFQSFKKDVMKCTFHELQQRFALPMNAESSSFRRDNWLKSLCVVS